LLKTFRNKVGENSALSLPWWRPTPEVTKLALA
jgi:hypothetical protein